MTEMSSPPQNPLAVVGMACCLPGAANLEEFWTLLLKGGCAIGESPPDRLDRELYYSPVRGQRGTTYSTKVGLVPPRPPTRWAASTSPTDWSGADPCHRILADVVLEACHHAQINPRQFPWSNTGVYVGHSGGSPLGGELAVAALAPEALDFLADVAEFRQLDGEMQRQVARDAVRQLRRCRPQRDLAGGPDVEAHRAATRIAAVLGVTGPQMAMDAACASSLVALHTASLAMEQGVIEAAIVAGASFHQSDSLILFSHAQSCSDRGSRPFDRDADGLVAAEGYVALLLVPLRRALAEGLPIQAVIRGIGISSDGRGKSLWAPRREGQMAAVRRAYHRDLSPADVQFIEAHATSTQVGDATELEALQDFFRPVLQNRRIPIGSVKSNLGHTLETAGLAGLLKTILALQQGVIPPTVNLQQPNDNLDWEKLCFTVPTKSIEWPTPSAGRPRCGAVNAFGIGGLNAHVVVAEYIARHDAGVPLPPVVPETSPPRPALSQSLGPRRTVPQPIAILGRGLVLPGAHGVTAWAELLRSGRSALVPPPAQRWRRLTLTDQEANGLADAEAVRGGFILNYEYDWRAHKIPPKQVQQANPLQFMLLDAAQQALQEARCLCEPADHEHTAVVVGANFGGDFGNQLQIGLRLPEIRRAIRDSLSSRGVPSDRIATILAEYSERILAAWPALLDETGSFTSSTLASRIAKTFHLMGGALALDSGDCSSAAALAVASDLLRSGRCRTVLCAVAQRAMDRAAWDSLVRHGRLARPHERTRGDYAPGEGVVALVLKQAPDVRQGCDRVLAWIDEIGFGADSSDLSRALRGAGNKLRECGQESAAQGVDLVFGCGVTNLDQREEAALREVWGQGRPSPRGVPLIRQIGHIQAVHGLAEVVQVLSNDPFRATVISSHSAAGIAAQVLLRPPSPEHRTDSTADMPSEQSQPTVSAKNAPFENWSTYCWGGDSAESVRAQVALTLSGQRSCGEALRHIFTNDAVRLAVVAQNETQLRQRLQLIVQHGFQPGRRDWFREQGIVLQLFPRAARPTLACVFPGQGSQFPEMLTGWASKSSRVAACLRAADEVLSSQFGETFSRLVAGETGRLGTDVWVTQMAMLVADWLAWSVLEELGICPDYVAGHSFGEIVALAASGSLSWQQALALTHDRATIWRGAATAGQGMLAIEASGDQVAEWLTAHPGRLFLSHRNTPRQCVVAGETQALSVLQDQLHGEGVAAIPLRVPAAYHTPLMESLLPAWQRALARYEFLPPRVPLLSSVNNRFVSDPEEIRELLLRQMVTPVDYVQLIERLARVGVDALLEVGPQRVLTQLHRKILPAGQIALLSLDHPSRSPAESWCLVQAELAALGCLRERVVETPVTAVPSRPHSADAIAEFDATAVRRRQNRGRRVRGVVRGETQNAIVSEFDASEARRRRKRGALAAHGDLAPERVAANLVADTRPNPLPLPTTESRGAEDQRLERFSSNEGKPRSTGPQTNGRLADFLIDYVVEQTGYPRELVDLDADLEADLGIDSIKRTQLVGEVREVFAASLSASELESLAACRNLRQILATVGEPAATTTESLVNAAQPLAEPVGPTGVESEAYRRGWDEAQRDAAAIWQQLRDQVDARESLAPDPTTAARSWSVAEQGRLQGMADALQVNREAIEAWVAASRNEGTEVHQESSAPIPSTEATGASQVTRRFVLRMEPTAEHSGEGGEVPWKLGGDSLILGQNVVGEALQAAIRRAGFSAICVATSEDGAEAVAALRQAWERQPLPHLFLVTPHDADAEQGVEQSSWERRRTRGILTPFQVLQQWWQLVRAANLTHVASAVAVVSLGGDFGIGGRVVAPESGALTGMLKALLIEGWVQGYRAMPIKVIDAEPDAPADEIARRVMRELAHPSYDVEISGRIGSRAVLRAVPRPVASPHTRPIRSGGVWLCSGGARGITSFVSRALAERFHLRMHWIGLAPPPEVPDDWLQLSADGLRELKWKVMQEAREVGKNAILEWEKVEKSLEIARNLRAAREVGVAVTYHACDLADRARVAALVDSIRREDGPISGVLHGAGIGRDARLDRKELRRVNECFRAKVDGAWSLMEATRDDPLEYFVAFGSISGRFGANGHTDYSAANDLLCKQMDWLQARRPETRVVGFHWHAWDDFGMATKPETRLALESVGMQFMPAREGLQHLIDELESSDHEVEVLITDDRYYRRFYPAERVSLGQGVIDQNSAPLPFFPGANQVGSGSPGKYRVDLDAREPFLREHRLRDCPILPLVVATELLAEAAILHSGGGHVAVVRELVARQALRVPHDSQAVSLQVYSRTAEELDCVLTADVSTREGHLLESDRVYFAAQIQLREGRSALPCVAPCEPTADWLPVVYPPRDSSFYLGFPFQCLRGYQLHEQSLDGWLQAPALGELAGDGRSVVRWQLPSAALDACLFATGILCWHRVKPGPTLPVGVGELRCGRLPVPGEMCVVRTRLVSRTEAEAVFHFQLQTRSGEVLLDAADYRVAWLVQ